MARGYNYTHSPFSGGKKKKKNLWTTAVESVSCSRTSVFQLDHEALQLARDQLVVAEQECSDALRVPRDAGQGWGHCRALPVQTQNTPMKTGKGNFKKKKKRKKKRDKVRKTN